MAHGGKREGAGRKPLTLEHKVRDLTSPHIPGAIETLVEIMNDDTAKSADRISASRLLLAYYFGQPKQMVDVETSGGGFVINLTKGNADS